MEWQNGLNDCWHFFRRVQLERFGRDVPTVDVDGLSTLACAKAFERHEERGDWSIVTLPQEGDAVLMGRGKRPTHVGIYVDANGGSVLHCTANAGSCLQRIPALKRDGWVNLVFYRHK
jgi:cell wall-associated NlpC family hydrolase